MADEGSFTTDSTLTVLIVDDDAFTREGVRLYLSQKGFAVIEAGDEESAWQAAITHHPAAAVVDILIPQTANTQANPIHSIGIRLVHHLKQMDPRLGVVLFSAYEDRGAEIVDLMQAGVHGLAYKLKGCRPEALLEAIQATLDGRIIIDPEVTSPRTLADELMKHLTVEERPIVECALGTFSQLTPQEWEVARLVAASHSIEGIAGELGVTAKSAENYMSRVYEKLGLDDLPAHLRKSNLLAKTCLIDDLRRQAISL